MSYQGILDADRVEIEKWDPEIAALFQKETRRLTEGLELIASENVMSPTVQAAMSNVMSNKYAEGYPGKRYYGGCEFHDSAEEIARQRLKKLFGAEHANVQPHSGAQANQAVFFAALNPGDQILGMDLAHGGHLTHGSAITLSGTYYRSAFYGVDENGFLDYAQVRAKAKEVQPKLMIAGASAYPRVIDFKKFREIADEVGALLMVDMAHIAGLVATGHHPSPLPYADFVTTTTHKTLRGPRGGAILCTKEFEKKIDKAVFPGIQGGPFMHAIAAKAVAFGEALNLNFRNYIENVCLNAKELGKQLEQRGFSLISGGTDNHLLLIDLRQSDMSGKDLENALAKANITVNKNSIPNDPRKPMVTSGIRIGTPAITTRGLKLEDMADVAEAIFLASKNTENDIEKALQIVQNICKKYPLYSGALGEKGTVV